jgi:transposase-like protein
LDQRTEFVTRALTEEITFTDLCKEYGIIRKTGYKWKQRLLRGDRRTVPLSPFRKGGRK